jgi:hypothetical protein
MITYQGPVNGSSVDVETLETVADWKESLQVRLRLARLRFEMIGGNTEEVVALGAEVADFKRTCKALKAVIHA